MITLFVAAATRMRRTFAITIIAVAAALLLPASTGAKSLPDLPAGHWAYNALAKVTGTGILQSIGETSYNPKQTRTRYELAMLVRKTQAVLDAQAFATPTKDLPAKVRITMREKGLERQLAALESVQTRLTQEAANPSVNVQKAKDVLAAQMPHLRTDVSTLADDTVRVVTSPASTDALAAQEKRIDKLLNVIQALRLQVATLVPILYQQVWSQVGPSTSDVLTEIIVQQEPALGWEEAKTRAAATMQTLSSLEREFQPELQALSIGTASSWPNLLSRLTATSPNSIVEGVLGAPWQVSGQSETHVVGSGIQGSEVQAATDGVPITPEFRQSLDVLLATHLTGGPSLSAAFSGSNNLLAPADKAISIDELSLQLKERTWRAEVSTELPEQSMHDLALQNQSVSGAKAQLGLGPVDSTLLVGRTRQGVPADVAAVDSHIRVGSNLKLQATLVGADSNVVPGSASGSNHSRTPIAGRQVDAAMQAHWQLSRALSLRSDVAVSELDKLNTGLDSTAFRLQANTAIPGIAMKANVHRTAQGFRPRLVEPSADTYTPGRTGYDIEAASALGPVAIHAGIGQDQRTSGGDATSTQKIGADYRFDLFGSTMKTGVEVKNESSAQNRTLTSKVNAQVPIGNTASVSARMELVDIDRLRNLTSAGVPSGPNGTGNTNATGQAKLGVDGALRLGDSGSLRIGYELKQSRDEKGPKLTSTADAGVEYSFSERARLAAGLNVDANAEGTKATTNVDVGYNLTRNSNLSARYQLINFSDVGSKDYNANVAQAKLTVKF